MSDEKARFAELLRTMTPVQLREMSGVLEALPPDAKVDVFAIVDEIRKPRSTEFRPKGPSHVQATKDDGGREYELLLRGLTDEVANAQYQREFDRVAELVAGGLAASEAWQRIRRDDPDTKTHVLYEQRPGRRGRKLLRTDEAKVSKPLRRRLRLSRQEPKPPLKPDKEPRSSGPYGDSRSGIERPPTPTIISGGRGPHWFGHETGHPGTHGL